MIPHPFASALLIALGTSLVGCTTAPEAGAAAATKAPTSPAAPSETPAPGAAPDPAEEALEDPSTPGGLDPERWQLAPGAEGLVEIAYRTASGDGIPRNAMTDLEVRLYREGRALPGARLIVRGWMPDHRHGFVHTPTIEDQGDGVFQVRDLLLHMRGHWQLTFDVILGNERDSATFDVRL